ncbi:MAG: hypothetical protein IPG17_28170 [Sandaracinaceae bacterium]|nr:hypothetical protein [Sandaracinaceae bacterium]MBK7154232.1 hypothetical protein [Sandaracinaceae bacterium]MBK7776379.1 hypothetical protein [Sandaracinaceae bacterium]
MRIFLSLVLAAGAVFGIGGGLARLHHGGRHHREHMMDRVAETCVRAARNVDDRDGYDGHDGHDGRGPRGPRGDHHAGPMHGPQHGPQPIFVPYPVAMPMPAMPTPPSAPTPGE